MNFQKRPWRSDPRSQNFSHSKLFGSLIAFPTSMYRPRGPVFDQKSTTRCTGYGSAANGWYIHGEPMNPDWSANKIGIKQGRSVDGYGGDPNATMKHQRDDGFLPLTINHLTLENSTIEETGYKQWNLSLDYEAENFDNISGYLKVDNRKQDYFDAIRTALLQNYNYTTHRGAGVDAFSGWYASWMNDIIQSPTSLLGFHRYLFIDMETIQGEPYLVAQNSYGKDFGDQGYQYFSRDVINWEFSQKNRTLKTLATLTPEQVAEMKKETPLANVIRRFVQLFERFSDTYGKNS